jgi:hypothetical protein
MLLTRRPPGIDKHPPDPGTGYEHLKPDWIALLRWLQANRVDFVLVGPVARAARGDREAAGPVALVLSPYRRNYERLARALYSAHARLRVDGDELQPSESLPVKVTAEKLARGHRWMLRCGAYDLDIEGHPDGTPRYQELLYEATRMQLADGIGAEVASPEDIEHYDQLRRTGVAPEIRVTRAGPDGS